MLVARRTLNIVRILVRVCLYAVFTEVQAAIKQQKEIDDKMKGIMTMFQSEREELREQVRALQEKNLRIETQTQPPRPQARTVRSTQKTRVFRWVCVGFPLHV